MKERGRERERGREGEREREREGEREGERERGREKGREGERERGRERNEGRGWCKEVEEGGIYHGSNSNDIIVGHVTTQPLPWGAVSRLLSARGHLT